MVAQVYRDVQLHVSFLQVLLTLLSATRRLLQSCFCVPGWLNHADLPKQPPCHSPDILCSCLAAQGLWRADLLHAWQQPQTWIGRGFLNRPLPFLAQDCPANLAEMCSAFCKTVLAWLKSLQSAKVQAKQPSPS